jgi:hypothetical protein
VITRKNRIKEINEARAILRKEDKKLAAEKAQLEKEAIHFMTEEGIEKLADDENNISIKTMDVPVMNDFMTFWNHVRKKNAPELLTQKVNSKAWKEHGQSIPGVGVFTRETLSITTRK